MADTFPTFTGSGLLGVSINATGAACVGTVTGDWITPLDGFRVTSWAIHYDEDGGTGMSAASLAAQVLIGSDAQAYTIANIALTANATAMTTDGSDIILPIAPLGPAGSTALLIDLAGIKAIRAVATVTGTGAGADALKVTFIGHRLTR